MEPQRPRLADQDSEDAAPARGRSDLRAQAVVDPVGHELFELSTARVYHSERREACAGKFGRRLDETVKQRVQRQLGSDCESRRKQCAQPSLADGKRVHARSLTSSGSPE